MNADHADENADENKARRAKEYDWLNVHVPATHDRGFGVVLALNAQTAVPPLATIRPIGPLK
jgi:hypothetical protein